MKYVSDLRSAYKGIMAEYHLFIFTYSKRNKVTEYDRGKIYAHTSKKLFPSLELKISVFAADSYSQKVLKKYTLNSNLLLEG